MARLDGGGDPLSLELGASFELLEQLRVLAHLATCSECVTPYHRAGLADMPDCACCGSGLEETAEHAFYFCEQVRLFWDHVGEWAARIEPKQLVLLDVGYVVYNVLPPFQGEKRVVFLAILAVARMMIWTTRNKGLYADANFSHCDLVLYFRHQLGVKIRCDRKRFDLWDLKVFYEGQWLRARLCCRKISDSIFWLYYFTPR